MPIVLRLFSTTFLNRRRTRFFMQINMEYPPNAALAGVLRHA
jgi:hypothetical protein